MCSWKRQPEENKNGTYQFSGTLYTTRGISDELPIEEILFLYWDIRTFAEQNNGADYLQSYVDCKGRKIFIIDQLSQQQLESGNYDRGDDYLTIMFASEY